MADFAGKTLEQYQDMVSKRNASVELGEPLSSRLIQKLAQADEEGFETVAETLDDRLLVSVKSFFKTLDDAGVHLEIGRWPQGIYSPTPRR